MDGRRPGVSAERRRRRQHAALERLVAVLDRGPRVEAVRLARLTGYSASRLRVLARIALGEPPARRQRRVRLDAAACTLLRGAVPVARLARAAGFSSTEGFHRAFRRRFGCAPRGLAVARGARALPRAIALGLAISDHFLHAPESAHA
jgi:AraC-like DNA-binding protein